MPLGSAYVTTTTIIIIIKSYTLRLEAWVVGFTTGSRGEVPGKKNLWQEMMMMIIITQSCPVLNSHHYMTWNVRGTENGFWTPALDGAVKLASRSSRLIPLSTEQALDVSKRRWRSESEEKIRVHAGNRILDVTTPTEYCSSSSSCDCSTDNVKCPSALLGTEIKSCWHTTRG
jgi:hypothetical protein